MSSEMLFTWLTDERTFLCARNVLKVDGVPVPDSHDRIERVLKDPVDGQTSRLRQLLDEGARFNALTPDLRAELVRQKPVLLALLASTFVTLKDGPTLPVAALAFALELEDRGFRLWLDVDGQAIVEPVKALSDTDQGAIHHWRHHLGAILAYTAEVEE